MSACHYLKCVSTDGNHLIRAMLMPSVDFKGHLACPYFNWLPLLIFNIFEYGTSPLPLLTLTLQWVAQGVTLEIDEDQEK